MRGRVAVAAGAIVALWPLAGLAGGGVPAADTAAGRSVVIRVGDAAVTAGEFADRLNLTPSAGNLAGGEERKTALAASLAAEMVLAAEARRLGLDTLAEIRAMTGEAEKEAVYERWMSEEITQRISVEPHELRGALKRFRQRRVAGYAVFPDSTAALAARRRLGKGAKLEALANGGRGPAVLTKTLDYAEALPEVEDAVFGLRPGEISPPVRVDGQYYLFQLSRILPHPRHSAGSLEYWRPSLERRVRARKAARLFEQAVPGLLKGKSFTINRGVFDYLAGEIARRLPFHDPEKLRVPEAINGELTRLPPGLEERLGEPLARFADGKVWTIGEVWRGLRYGPYLLNYRSEQDFRAGFPGLIRQMVIFETVVEEGYRRRLERSDYVRRETRMWSDNLLARAYQARVRDTIQVDEADARAWYGKYGAHYTRPELRRIQEIVVADRRLAERLVDSLHKGAEMTALVRRHGLPVGESVRHPEGFWIARQTYGEPGAAALTLQPGGIAGPIALDSIHVSIIKLLAVQPEGPAPFDEVKARVQEDLLQARTHTALSAQVESRAGEYDIRIDRRALAGVNVLEGAMFAYKSHFPNRPAVPGTVPFDPRSSWFTRAAGAPQEGRP